MTIKFTSIFIALIFFAGCKVNESVVSADKKKLKWLESLVVEEDHYQVIVTVPKSDSMTENANKTEKEGRFKMASEIVKMSNDQSGKLLEEIIEKDSEKEIVGRFKQNEIAKGILNMEVFSSYKSSDEYSVCYRINKSEYEKLRIEAKRKAVNSALVHLGSARKYKSSRNPLEAAKEYSNALIAIQEFLYEPVDYVGEGVIKNLDKVIFEEMLIFRNELSIKCDPAKVIVLNHANGYAGIISFEVLQANEKTGNINVSIDVAGLRNESIAVNGYSVLVGNLPANLGNPYVTLRSDMFDNLRVKGNGLCAMIYQKLSPITEKVKISRVYPNINILLHSDSNWDNKAFEMFKAGIESSAMSFEENESESTISITPQIYYTEEEKQGHVRITGQWMLNFDNGIERYVGRKIILTKTSKDKALRDLNAQLNSELSSGVLTDLSQIIEQL